MIYVKINETNYPATVVGKMSDSEWDNRESKAITLEGDYETINALFKDDTIWSIIQEEAITNINENGEDTTETKQTEFDNSEFNIRGDLTVHTNGTCTVKMGKETELESAYTLLYGGVK